MIHTALPGFSYPSKPIESFIPDGYVGTRNTPTLPDLRKAILSIRVDALQFFRNCTKRYGRGQPGIHQGLQCGHSLGYAKTRVCLWHSRNNNSIAVGGRYSSRVRHHKMARQRQPFRISHQDPLGPEGCAA